jgi:hypothetical protein
VKEAEEDGFKESVTTGGKLGTARLIVAKRMATRPRDLWATKRPKNKEQEVGKQHLQLMEEKRRSFAVCTYLSGRDGSSR